MVANILSSLFSYLLNLMNANPYTRITRIKNDLNTIRETNQEAWSDFTRSALKVHLINQERVRDAVKRNHSSH